MKKGTKILLLFLIVVLISGAKDAVFDSNKGDVAVAVKTEEIEASEPVEFWEQIHNDLNGDGVYGILATGYNESTGQAIVEISSGYTADHGLFQRTVSRKTFEIMESMVARGYENVSSVYIYSETTLRNNKGNPVEVTAYQFMVSMENARTVDWTYLLEETTDPLRYAKANADHFYLNPALM